MKDKPSKILVVDDEEVLTTLICDYFKYHESGIVPIVTNDPRQVLPMLEEHTDVRLILSDFRMPGINGLELLLRVKAKHPKMLFVIMTGYGTQELKKAGLRRGAIRYIEKPIDLVELSEIIRVELKEQVSGFGGMVEAVQLPDIIQMIGMSRRTITLNIIADKKRGNIFFRDGEVVHAVCGKKVGESAFYEIIKWYGGRFALAEPQSRMKQTITQSWQGLLLDAARIQDEARASLSAAKKADDNKLIMSDNGNIDTSETADEYADINLLDDKDYESRAESDTQVESDTVKILEDGGSILKDQSILSFDELYDDLIADIHKNALQYYLKTWPEGEQNLAFNALPLNRLTVNLRRHFFFNFHLHWTRMISKQDVPFDFNNESIAKALQNLLLTLRKNWIISYRQYHEMLDESLRFEITHYIDPAKALALFVQKYTSGKAEKTISILQIMMENKLIGGEYESLNKDIGLLGVSHIRLKKLEDYLKAIVDARTEEEIFNEIRRSLQQLIEIVGINGNDSSREIDISIMMVMLKSRGLDNLANNIYSEMDDSKQSLSIEDFDSILEELQMQSKRSRKILS